MPFAIFSLGQTKLRHPILCPYRKKFFANEWINITFIFPSANILKGAASTSILPLLNPFFKKLNFKKFFFYMKTWYDISKITVWSLSFMISFKTLHCERLRSFPGKSLWIQYLIGKNHLLGYDWRFAKWLLSF